MLAGQENSACSFPYALRAARALQNGRGEGQPPIREIILRWQGHNPLNQRFLLACAFSILIQTAGAQAPANSSGAPDDPLAEARRLLERDQPGEALKLLEPLRAHTPAIKGLEHELGLVYYRSGKLVEAERAFSAAIKDDGGDRESVQMAGLTLYRLGRPGDAIPYLEQVRQWMPGANADATYVLGLCYLNARRYDDARRAFALQFGLPEDSAGAHLLMGVMLRRAGLPELAEGEAQKAAELAPKQPLVHFMLGEVALLKGDVPRAVNELEVERQLNPGYAPLYDRLGDAYLRVDKLDEAQQALTKAIALDSTLTSAFIKMGKALLRRQDAMTAVMYLKHAETMDPGDAVTHSLLSQAYHRLGRDDEARREMDLAAKIHGAQQPAQGENK